MSANTTSVTSVNNLGAAELHEVTPSTQPIQPANLAATLRAKTRANITYLTQYLGLKIQPNSHGKYVFNCLSCDKTDHVFFDVSFLTA